MTSVSYLPIISSRTTTSRNVSNKCNKILLLAVVCIIVHTLTHLPLLSNGLVLNPVEKVLFQKRVDTIRRSIKQTQQPLQQNDTNDDAQQTRLLFPISTYLSDVSSNRKDQNAIRTDDERKTSCSCRWDSTRRRELKHV